MSTQRNDLEEFIYKICYQPIWTAVNNYIAVHPTSLRLSTSRVKYPDSAMLLDMMLEYTNNISIDEDTLHFDAIISCTIELQQNDDYKGTLTGETSQWIIASCEATITDKLDRLKITDVHTWTKGKKPVASGISASNNIVPVLYKKDLDAEATAFLEKYCPQALLEPMPVPIEKIATEELHLTVLQGHRITDDFSIFGQICFSKGKVLVRDIFKCSETEMDVNRGTILIDAYTFWERNKGCANNTLAHEVYHWHRHRLYAAIKQILRNEKFIAHRCPSNMSYPSEYEEWTNEQRMEWQANNMAPRILMPIQTFKIKVDELYQKYNYDDNTLKAAVLTCIADELAKFYGVSRQSALIRMKETGYPEAQLVLQQLTSAVRMFFTSTVQMKALENFSILENSNTLMVISSSMTKNTFKRTNPANALLPNMLGIILKNVPYHSLGNELNIPQQKGIFLRRFFIELMTNKKYQPMIRSRTHLLQNFLTNYRKNVLALK